MTAANAQDDDLICLSISLSAFQNAHLAAKKKPTTITNNSKNPLAL
jgi:hypothetical protein